MDAIQNYCYFASCWDLCFLLSSTIVLTLLTCLARKILHGSFLWDGRGSQLWERSQAGPPRCTDLHSKTQQTELKSRGWPQAAAEEKEDNASAKAFLASQFRDLNEKERCISQRPPPPQNSIRQLLCNDMTCVLCEQVAVEAKKLAYPRELCYWFFRLLKPSIPLIFSMGFSRLSGIIHIDRKVPITKPVLRAQSCPLPSSRRSLRKKGERVVLTSNKVPFQGAQSTHPLATVIPSAPPWMPPTAESGSAQLGVPTHLEVLESHILRKRLQHQWGLPSLTQRSLCRFLPAPPPSIARPDSPWCAQLEENTLPVTNQLTFIPLGTKKLLENHLKRMIVERQWGLPKRVKESLRGFIPVSAPLTKRPREGEKAPLPPELRRPKMKGPPPEKASSPPERPAGCSERRPLEGLCEWKQGMAGPLAKKALKIQLDCLSHREITHQAEKSSLPKVLPPGLKGVRLRSQQLPFVEHDILDRIQFNIKHKQLAHRWGLPTLYSKSVARLFHGTAPPAPDPLLPAQATTVRFSAAETLFVAKGIREKLEWHVKRKRLQHAWGLPDLVQRSLRKLLPAVPLQCRQKPGLRNVIVLPDQLSFLSKETTHKLNRNVLKRVVLQRWGLPSRVLQSLRLLYPEMGFGSPGRNASKPHQALSDSIRGDFPGPLAVSGDRRIRSRRTAVAPHKAPLPCPMLGPEELEKMEHHLAKKSVEVQLGAFPPLSRFSWRLVLLSTKQLLPRLICPGQKSLRLRSGFLPFVPPDDVVRLELSVRRSHLASLWGLGLRYVEALSGMVPKPRLVSLLPRWTGIEFTEVHIIFLPQPAKDALEVHIQKKRLQHLWGVPALIRRSLEAFMQGFPQLPSRQLTEVHVSTMRQELSFLPCSVCSHLELHVQKTKLHRQWGLPRRVLASLKCLCPEAGSLALRQKVARAPFGLLHSGGGSPPELWSVGTVSMGPGTRKAERIVGDATPQPLPPEWSVGTVSMGPGTRKAERIVGDATPQPLPPEWWSVGTVSMGPGTRKAERIVGDATPQLLPPESWSVGTVSTGPGTKKAERMVRTAASQPLPSILAAKDLEKVKLRLARKCVEVQLGALPAMVKLSWRRAALSSRQPLPQLILPGCRALQPRRHFLTFARREDVERMELAVQHNHLISLWGLGVSYVEALGVMMPKPPLQPPRRRTTAFRFLDMKTPFLQEQEREALELHVKKKKIQHMWGLPVLIQRSLLCFTHRTPSVHICHKAKIAVHIEHLQPSFISEGVCRSLELHIQKMKLQRLWRLPGRVREALKGFVPSSSLVIMGRDSRPQRSTLTTQNLLRFTEGLNFTEEMRGRDKPGADVRQRAEDEEEVQLEEPQVCGGETSTEESTSGKGISTGCSIGPVSISHEEKEMDVSWKFRKEDAAPYPASRVQLVTKESKAPLMAKKMTSAGNEPLRMMRPQSEGGGERARQPQFLLKGDSMLPVPHKAIDKKLSLIGSILEKKLYLKHGLQAWLRNQERQKEKSIKRGLMEVVHAEEVWHKEDIQNDSGTAYTTEEAVTVRLEEMQCGCIQAAASVLQAKKETLDLITAPTQEAQLFQAGRMESFVALAEAAVGSTSWKSSRLSHKGAESSFENSGEGDEGNGRRLMRQERKLGIISQEKLVVSKERRSSSKERRSSSKERRSSSKERRSSSKERRSSSKRLVSKERWSSSKRSSSKEWCSSRKFWRPSSKRSSSKVWRPSKRSSSKEQWSSSKEQQLSSKRSSSKERQLSSKRMSCKKQRWSRSSRSSSKERRSSSKERWLSSKRLSSKEQKWSSKRSSSKERRPSSKRSSSKEQCLSSKRPSSIERRSNSKQSTSIEWRSSSKDYRSRTSKVTSDSSVESISSA
ncbi:uncharacterized protein LOC128343437 isoform X2 [Hemicordylus capensis]|uniref:uncharacterized protein LOC128343437 isoform X2 n=1 Tax=Hemicordylus capensis TaxID=884348 RepID=UPI0023025BBF|nr:uncharacterized protein LOC128343437 isoform X2 [Hemicordylus capensis]